MPLLATFMLPSYAFQKAGRAKIGAGAAKASAGRANKAGAANGAPRRVLGGGRGKMVSGRVSHLCILFNSICVYVVVRYFWVEILTVWLSRWRLGG